MIRPFKIRKYRLFENAPAAVAAPVTNNQNTNQNMNVGDDNEPAKLTVDDVANLSPGEVINYVYVNIPNNLDPQVKQALLNRADEIRKDAEAGKETKQRAEQILNSIKMTLPNLK